MCADAATERAARAAAEEINATKLPGSNWDSVSGSSGHVDIIAAIILRHMGRDAEAKFRGMLERGVAFANLVSCLADLGDSPKSVRDHLSNAAPLAEKFKAEARALLAGGKEGGEG